MDIIFNIAKGRIAHYGTLPGANDALVVIPMRAAGMPTDDALKDYATLSAVFGAGGVEETAMGRKDITSVTVNVDNANDRTDVDFADVVWTAATGDPIGSVLICYDPDTTSGTDADIIPLTKHDFTVTPNGGDITAVLAVNGFYRVS